jgi:hypothetical protein
MLGPFITSNPPDARVLFENFGLTFYYAQLVEDNLKLILAMGEIQGIVTFDRRKDLHIKDSDSDLIGACMGALKDVLKRNRGPNDSEEFYQLFDEANAARRLLAHRFFLEHAPDLQSQAGRLAINQDLSRLYLTIRNAHNASVALRDELYSRVGFTPEMARQKMEEFRKLICEKPENET